MFAGTCFGLCKRCHKKQDCWKNPEMKQNGKQAFTVITIEDEGWLLDSGESRHMCPFEVAFVVIRPLKISVDNSVANGETVTATGVETIRVVLNTQNPICNEDVLYVPKLDRIFLLISALSVKGLQIIFRKTHVRSGTNTKW